LGFLTVILLIIALVIFTATWVANMMFKMQRDHEEKIKEITGHNNVQNQVNIADIESN
jgi:flagellar basal body-associated protein FliL